MTTPPSPASLAPQAPASPQPSYQDVGAARASLDSTYAQPAASHPVERTGAPPAPAPEGSRWPDPRFFAATMAAFPAKGVCSVEEARALIDGGYTILDVRTGERAN